MWKLCTTLTALMSLLLASVEAGQNNEFSEYNITPGKRVAYYYYPAPPKSQQFNEPPAKQLAAKPIPNIAPATRQHSVVSAAQPYQNQNQYQYHGNYRTGSFITKKFASPALDNAAFTLALTNQGFTFVNAAAVNAALTSNSRSNQPVAIRTSSLRVLPASSSSSSKSASLSVPTLTSLNVKLPLPIGITPLNIAPLPLQAGAPYTAIHNIVTSYGTPYHQRKRR